MSVSRYRVIQIRSVAAGMAGFVVALAGSAIENRAVVMAGLGMFAAALASIIVVGILAWWKHG